MKNQRLYLDYNATSPLASSVKELLASGDFPFANPSSQHHSGKFARKKINEVTHYFKEVYSLKEEYEILYHSGATEGINLFCSQVKEDDVFIGFNSDHPAVTNQYKKFEEKKITNLWLNPAASGDFPLEAVNELLRTHFDKKVFLNFTWVHNETGVVWPLSLLDELHHDDLIIHVDAVQSVAKTSSFLKLSPRAMMYTFSGHKFGALKGMGLSFINKNFKLAPLLYGGAQQNGLRSGTENPLGALTLMLAHKEWSEAFNIDKMQELQSAIISELKNSLQDDFLLVGEKAQQKNVNTVDFIHKKSKADLLLMQFDLNGMDVSSGSACSSGQVHASQTLISMGLEEFSKNSIRISFSPFEISLTKEITEILRKVFKK